MSIGKSYLVPGIFDHELDLVLVGEGDSFLDIVGARDGYGKGGQTTKGAGLEGWSLGKDGEQPAVFTEAVFPVHGQRSLVSSRRGSCHVRGIHEPVQCLHGSHSVGSCKSIQVVVLDVGALGIVVRFAGVARGSPWGDLDETTADRLVESRPARSSYRIRESVASGKNRAAGEVELTGPA